MTKIVDEGIAGDVRGAGDEKAEWSGGKESDR